MAFGIVRTKLFTSLQYYGERNKKAAYTSKITDATQLLYCKF